MIELPGCRSGSASSASPVRGPDPSQRRSLAILNSDTATVRSAPEASTSPSRAPWASMWSGASLSASSPVAARSSSTTPAANPSGALSPVPTAVPPIGSCPSRGSTSRQRAAPYSAWVAQPPASWPSVIGTASIRWVRPALTISRPVVGAAAQRRGQVLQRGDHVGDQRLGGGEVDRLVHQRPVGLLRAVGEVVEQRVGRLGVVPEPLDVEQAGLQRGRDQRLEVAPGAVGVAVLGGDHLALLGDPQRPGDGARRLRADRLVARPAAPADRAAAAVEQPQPDALAPAPPRPGPARPGTAPSWRRGSRRPCCCRSSRA